MVWRFEYSRQSTHSASENFNHFWSVVGQFPLSKPLKSFEIRVEQTSCFCRDIASICRKRREAIFITVLKAPPAGVHCTDKSVKLIMVTLIFIIGGHSALHIASLEGHGQIVNSLIDNGFADIFAADNKGYTATQHAASNG